MVSEYFNKKQINSAKILLETVIYPAINVLEYFCHDQLNDSWQDFPSGSWNRLKHDLNIIS